MAGLGWNESTTNTLFFSRSGRQGSFHGWELLDRLHFWTLDDFFIRLDLFSSEWMTSGASFGGIGGGCLDGGLTRPRFFSCSCWGFCGRDRLCWGLVIGVDGGMGEYALGSGCLCFTGLCFWLLVCFFLPLSVLLCSGAMVVRLVGLGLSALVHRHTQYLPSVFKGLEFCGRFVCIS